MKGASVAQYGPAAMQAVNQGQAQIIYANGGSTGGATPAAGKPSPTTITTQLVLDSEIVATQVNTVNNNSTSSGAIITEND